MTTRRERNARSAEISAAAVLVAYPGEWFRAVEVSQLVAKPWRPLAFALRLLAERGAVEEEIIEVPGAARAVEQSRQYRLGLPAFEHPWLLRILPLPPRWAIRRVDGRYWDRQD